EPCDPWLFSLDLILLPSHVVYCVLSLRHISHWLALSSKTSSRTMVTQSLAGHTASHTPQPQHDSMLASERPSGVTSKHESGHWIQHRVHLTHLSKSMTGRMVRVVYFLKYGLLCGTAPVPPSMGLPTGMAGMVTPSRISHHLGISKENGVSVLPSLGFTARVSRRSWALRAEATLRSEPHSASLIASQTASRERKSGLIRASAPRMRASVWSSLKTQRPEKEALARISAMLSGVSFLWMSLRRSPACWTEVISTVPFGRVSRLIGWRPYQAQDSTPLARVSSTQIVMSTSFGSYRAMFCSSSSWVSATMAKSLAGIPLRWGLSPYRPNAIPHRPAFRAERT